MTRELFAEAVRAEGIPLDPGFPALHQTHARSRYPVDSVLSNNATIASQSVVTLHHPILLCSPSEVTDVVKAIQRIQESGESIVSTDADGWVNTLSRKWPLLFATPLPVRQPVVGD